MPEHGRVWQSMAQGARYPTSFPSPQFVGNNAPSPITWSVEVSRVKKAGRRRKQNGQADFATQTPPEPNVPTSHLACWRGRTLKPFSPSPRAGSMFMIKAIFESRWSIPIQPALDSQHATNKYFKYGI